MWVLGTIALVMIVLAGYTAGLTLANWGKGVSPRLSDLLFIVLLWTASLAVRGAIGRWLSLLVWALAAAAAGGLLATIRATPTETASLPEGGGRLWQRVWKRWKYFTQAMANFQARVFLGFFYFLVVTPFGLISRAFGDPLKVRSRADGSNWHGCSRAEQTVEEARRQG